MSSEKRVVFLRGGHFDGQPVDVHPVRQRIVLPYVRGLREYGPGEWGREDSPPVVTTLVSWEAYERVDADTFEVAA